MPGDIIVSDVTLLDGRNVDIRIAGRSIAELAEARTLSEGRSLAGGGGLCVRPFADSHIHIDKAGTALLSDDAPITIGEAIATMGSVKKEAAANPRRHLRPDGIHAGTFAQGWYALRARPRRRGRNVGISRLRKNSIFYLSVGIVGVRYARTFS